MKIIQFIKKQIDKQKQNEVEKQKKYLEVYFARLYTQQDAGMVAIPPFIKAQDTVRRLNERGLLNIAYKQIKEG